MQREESKKFINEKSKQVKKVFTKESKLIRDVPATMLTIENKNSMINSRK